MSGSNLNLAQLLFILNCAYSNAKHNAEATSARLESLTGEGLQSPIDQIDREALLAAVLDVNGRQLLHAFDASPDETTLYFRVPGSASVNRLFAVTVGKTYLGLRFCSIHDYNEVYSNAIVDTELQEVSCTAMLSSVGVVGPKMLSDFAQRYKQMSGVPANFKQMGHLRRDKQHALLRRAASAIEAMQ